MKNKNIIRYKFEDAIRMMNLCDIGNALLFFVFCFGGLSVLFNSFHAQICGLTALIFFIINQNYNWRNTAVNSLLAMVYFGLFIMEVWNAGVPELPVDHSFGKGILLNVLIGIAPEVYTALRLLFIIPLLNIIFIEKPKLIV